VTTGTGGTDTTGLAVDNWIIEDNLFRRCNGESEIISVKSSQNVVRNNTFLECVGYISLRFGNATEVSGNWILGVGAMSGSRKSGGVRVTGEDHRIFDNYIHSVSGMAFLVHDAWPSQLYRVVKNVSIVNNTVVNSLEAGFLIGQTFAPIAGLPTPDNTPPESLLVANNVVWTSNGTPLEYVTPPTSITFAGDIMYNAPIQVSPVPAGITQINPGLQTVVTNGYTTYTPSSTSPVIDAATGSYPYVSTDITGKPRPSGSASDIGAHEVSTAPALRGPLIKTDVGPSYT
jgi:poly(beta-D-mannuronate) lyase